MPDGDGTIRRNVEPRLRGEKAPHLPFGAELGRKAGGEDILGLMPLVHRHILIHEIFIFNNKISIRRFEISEGINQKHAKILKTRQKVPMTH